MLKLRDTFVTAVSIAIVATLIILNVWIYFEEVHVFVCILLNILSFAMWMSWGTSSQFRKRITAIENRVKR